ncbi:hypothetical protein QAD02_007594 [Eretmocerus hayati]|uniref:Uncharacterized protein n=1 Tax=Eretmocerus hayati TaxID=131215 RepID=A0ACC2N4E6_9HYME|nr:hypothetical protein QAD02_007594 [Eretmocerus hayati]
MGSEVGANKKKKSHPTSYDVCGRCDMSDLEKAYPMRANYIFIDMQGYTIGYAKQVFIPKEIALINQELKECITTYEPLHYTIEPPHDIKNLETRELKNMIHHFNYGNNIP